MNRRKKRILISTLSIIPIVTVASTIIAIEVNKKNENKNNELSYLQDFRNWKNLDEEEINDKEEYLYYFNDNYYSSYDELLNSYLEDNKDTITSNLLYMGQLEFDKDNAISNMATDLRKYDRTKIIPAYQKANSQYTSEKSIAKSSYINETRFVTKYTDFNGNLFDSEKQAENSIKSTKISTPILYYELKDGTKINPLSKTDINEFKKTLYKNFREFLYPKKQQKDTNI
ncbi:MAG: hypothetical protein K2I49_00755, partial [Ureaplasma sp.]|nr:hypothetical protein [Ureaplasma sp.]